METTTKGREIVCTLKITNCYYKHGCSLCGCGSSARHWTVCEGKDPETGKSITIGEGCLRVGDIDARLRHLAEEYPQDAGWLLGMVGRLRVPSGDEYAEVERAAEAEGPTRRAYEAWHPDATASHATKDAPAQWSELPF